MIPEFEAVQAALDEIRAAEGDSQYLGAWPLVDAVEALMRTVDPIETGREAALAQWEARWVALRRVLASAEYVALLERIEQSIPVGLPVGERWVHRHAGRVNIQLEPERVARLVEVLRAAGAHPSGLGSYPAANDANALADDIAAMAEGQGVK